MTLTTVRAPQRLSYAWSSGPDADAGQVVLSLTPVVGDTLVQYQFTGDACASDLVVLRGLALVGLDRLAAVLAAGESR